MQDMRYTIFVGATLKESPRQVNILFRSKQRALDMVMNLLNKGYDLGLCTLKKEGNALILMELTEFKAKEINAR